SIGFVHCEPSRSGLLSLCSQQSEVCQVPRASLVRRQHRNHSSIDELSARRSRRRTMTWINAKIHWLLAFPRGRFTGIGTRFCQGGDQCGFSFPSTVPPVRTEPWRTRYRSPRGAPVPRSRCCSCRNQQTLDTSEVSGITSVGADTERAAEQSEKV